MLIKTCIIAALILAVGYLRSVFEAKKPGFILNPQTVIKSWFSENNWKARFSLLFAPLIFVYNLIAWIVYGLISFIDLLVVVVRGVAWVLRWFWNEVLQTTVFALIRLIWHYIVIFSFKFFENALRKIPEAIQKDKLIFAFRKLWLPTLIATVFAIVYFLTTSLIFLVLAVLILFYLFQYTAFVTVARFRSRPEGRHLVTPGLKTSIIWLGFASLSTALMVLLHSYSDIMVVAALGITLLHILLPIAVLFGLAFALSTCYLPAYMDEFGTRFRISHFWKTLFYRLPKIIVGQAFQFVGLAVIALIPVLIMLMLNVGVKEITQKDYLQWAKEVVVMDYHLPAVKYNREKKETLEKVRLTIGHTNDSIAKLYDQRIVELKAELKEANELKAQIKPDILHSMGRSAYVGEYQSFSLATKPACNTYSWVIVNLANGRELRRSNVTAATGSGSLVFYHEWRAPGKYRVTLTSRRPCTIAFNTSIDVEVLPVPETNAADSASAFVVPETRYFVSTEAADYAIDLIQGQLGSLEEEKVSETKDFAAQLRQLEDRIDFLTINTQEQKQMLITKIIAVVGLASLLLLLLVFLWPYGVLYHYDLLGFEQKGKHYWQTMLESMQKRNRHQPFLGVFVLILLSLPAIFWEKCRCWIEWAIGLIS